MVALSHATARELGYAPPPDSEDAKRPFVEVSGRKGLGVKADDLLDTLIRSAASEVGKRNPELDTDEERRISRMIAIAAVRYFLIKFSRGKVIAFDLEEAISFQGETGPYIQYAIVRINNIFRKLQERDGLDESALVATLAQLPAGELAGDNGHELWALVLEAARLDEIVDQVIATLEFSVLAKYAFGLAQAFNAFYNLHPSRSSIFNEERDNVRRWRAAAVIYVRDQLTRALDLMGVGKKPHEVAEPIRDVDESGEALEQTERALALLAGVLVDAGDAESHRCRAHLVTHTLDGQRLGPGGAQRKTRRNVEASTGEKGTRAHRRGS
jgi:arginyl-tRNA synthetase